MLNSYGKSKNKYFLVFKGIEKEEIELKLQSTPSLERKSLNKSNRRSMTNSSLRKSNRRRRKGKKQRRKISKTQEHVHSNSR